MAVVDGQGIPLQEGNIASASLAETLIVRHHPRQAGFADFYDRDSGSAGLISSRYHCHFGSQALTKGATLSISGRNRKTMELALNKTTNCWVVPSQEKE